MEPRRYNQFDPPPEEDKPDGPQYARPDSPYIPDPQHPGYFLNTFTGQRVTADELNKYVSSAPTAQPAPPQQEQDFNAMRGVAPSAQPQQQVPVQEQEQSNSKMPYLPFTIKTPKLPKNNVGPTPIGYTQEKEPLPTRMKIIFGAVAGLFLITLGLVITAVNNPAERKADTSDVLLAIAHQEEIIRIIDEYQKNAQDSQLENNMATSRSVLLTAKLRLESEAGEIDSDQYKQAQATVIDADVEPLLQKANRDNQFDSVYTDTFDTLIEKNRRQIQVLIANSTETEQLRRLNTMNEDLRNLLSAATLQKLELESS